MYIHTNFVRIYVHIAYLPQLTHVHSGISSGLEDIVLSVRNGIPPPPRHWHDLQEGEDTCKE